MPFKDGVLLVYTVIAVLMFVIFFSVIILRRNFEDNEEAEETEKEGIKVAEEKRAEE